MMPLIIVFGLKVAKLKHTDLIGCPLHFPEILLCPEMLYFTLICFSVDFDFVAFHRFLNDFSDFVQSRIDTGMFDTGICRVLKIIYL